jgi:hypothetical protein
MENGAMPIEDFKYFPIDQSVRRADFSSASVRESERAQPITTAARQVNAMSMAGVQSNEASVETAQLNMSPVDVQLRRDAENAEPTMTVETTLWNDTSQIMETSAEDAPSNEICVEGEPPNETSLQVAPLNETTTEVAEPDGTTLKDVQSNETSAEDTSAATDEASAKQIAKEQLLKYGKPLLMATAKMTTRFGLRMLNGLAGGLIPVDGVMGLAEGFAPSPDVILENLGGVATTLGIVQTATDTAAGMTDMGLTGAPTESALATIEGSTENAVSGDTPADPTEQPQEQTVPAGDEVMAAMLLVSPPVPANITPEQAFTGAPPSKTSGLFPGAEAFFGRSTNFASMRGSTAGTDRHPGNANHENAAKFGKALLDFVVAFKRPGNHASPAEGSSGRGEGAPGFARGNNPAIADIMKKFVSRMQQAGRFRSGTRTKASTGEAAHVPSNPVLTSSMAPTRSATVASPSAEPTERPAKSPYSPSEEPSPQIHFPGLASDATNPGSFLTSNAFEGNTTPHMEGNQWSDRQHR